MWRWPTVQAQKEAWAKIKSKVNAIHAKLIALAALRWADPKENNALADAMTDAKKAGVTIDVIDRAVKRGAGHDDSDKKVEEISYEGFLSGGVAIIIRALTDNRNRTAPSIRHLFSAYGWSLWETGSASNYLYDYQWQIRIIEPDDIESLELALLETEALDYTIEGWVVVIRTDRMTLANVKNSIELWWYTIEFSGFAYIPRSYSEVTDFDTALKVYSFLEACEADEDIESVWNNADISDTLWEECRAKVEASRFRT